MSFRLIVTVYRNEKAEHREAFERSHVTLGASPENDIVLADPYVSWRHAEVSLSRGTVRYRDTSTNGSFLAGDRIDDREVSQDDRVGIPPFEVSFELVVEKREGTLMRAGDELRRDVQALGAPADPQDLAPTTPLAAADRPVDHPSAAPEAADLGVSTRPLLDEVQPAFETGESDDLEHARLSGPLSTDRPEPELGLPEPSEDERDAVLSPQPLPPTVAVATGAPAVPSDNDATVDPQPIAATSSLRLDVVGGPQTWIGRMFPVEKSTIIVGRAPDADVRLDLNTVSRRHARLLRHPSDSWRVEDLGSANGTYLNERRVVSARLSTGDRLRFGHELTVELHDNDEISPPILEAGELVIDLSRPANSDSALIVQVTGRVDGFNYSDLGRRLRGLIDSGEQRLAIDLTGVDFIDHTGLGVLVNTATAIDRAGGRLRLVGVGERLLQALSLSRLDMFFRGRIATDLDAAVQALTSKTGKIR